MSNLAPRTRKPRRLCQFATLIAVGMMVVVSSGCSTYMASGLSASTTPMINESGETRSYTIIAHEVGKAKRTYLFGFIRWGKNLVPLAIDDAVAKHNGDGMINVTVDSKLTQYPFVVVQKTLVEGDVIRFK